MCVLQVYWSTINIEERVDFMGNNIQHKGAENVKTKKAHLLDSERQEETELGILGLKEQGWEMWAGTLKTNRFLSQRKLS